MSKASLGFRGVVIVAVAVIMAATLINVAYASSKPQIIQAVPGSLIYVPGGPNFNPYVPHNMVGNIVTYLPLAFYNPFTGVFYPVLARNWTTQVLPNGSGILTVYLRRNIYWFNGSAVLPFTAWDVYAEFYIGVKAFHWYYPFMQP